MNPVITTIVKLVALVATIIFLAMAIVSRPGVKYQQDYPDLSAANNFFQMGVIAFVFALISFGLSLLGATNNKLVGLGDAAGHVLVAIFIVMYTAYAMDVSLFRYNYKKDYVCSKPPQPPSEILSDKNAGSTKLTNEEEDLLACIAENGIYYDICMCQVKLASKYTLTIVAYSFGLISGLTHTVVGLLALLMFKK
jgi:hypothetical protein